MLLLLQIRFVHSLITVDQPPGVKLPVVCFFLLPVLVSDSTLLVSVLLCSFDPCRWVQQQGMSVPAHWPRVQDQGLSLVRPRLLQTRWVPQRSVLAANQSSSAPPLPPLPLCCSYLSHWPFLSICLSQVPTADTDTQEEWSVWITWSVSVRKENPVNLCSKLDSWFDSYIIFLSVLWSEYDELSFSKLRDVRRQVQI